MTVDHLDEQYAGRSSLRSLAEIVGATDAAQFIHRYERVPGTEYQVRHRREGCAFCDALDAVGRALECYRQLAKIHHYGAERNSAEERHD